MKEKKEYGVPVASRISEDDNELLVDLCWNRGETRNIYLRRIIHDHLESIRSDRKKLVRKD